MPMLHGAINAITLFASFLPSLLAGEVAFREDFRDDVTAHIPVTPNDLTSKFLGLKRLGPGADKLKLSYHPEIANDPHYIWNGECTGPTLIAFPFQKQLDLSASNWSLRLRTKNVGKSRLHLAVQVGQKWYVRKESIKNQKNWNVQSIPLHRPTWRSLNPTQVSFGDEVSNIDLTKVDALGFAAPLKPNRSKDCIRLDWFELIQGTTSLPPNGFLEPQTPFLRSALTFEHEGQKHSIPRGLLVPLGNGKSWACFDPDTLRWVVTWKAPSGNPPLTYDSMAAISFPNAKAKARRLPKLQGDILIVNPDTPESHSGHWLGTTLTDSGVEVHYELNGKRFTESASLEGENFVLIIHERGGASNKHTYDHNGRQTITKTSPRASRPANPTFPTVYRTKKTPPQNNGPFAVRNITFPQSPRPIRATDIAFLSSGTALLSTLDGDIWRITDLEKQNSTWTRVATGIFEPMAIEISADDKIYTLGRDQITELIDSNGDGHFDYFRNASDAFHQSSHTRDYATSLALGQDGSFFIAKGGINMGGKKASKAPSAPHRGTLLKISPDGKKCQVLADGLRLPYVGRRNDGTVFASDQQGHHVPSTPVYQISESNNISYFGHTPTNHRNEKTIAEPFVYFPYQINRSGAAFADLSKSPLLSDFTPGFTHLSWNGAIFSILTPERGRNFSYRWPLDLEFPSLNAAIHPQSGRLYATGLGISGYLPTTPKTVGLASIEQITTFPRPAELDVREDLITVRFQRPLTQDETVSVGTPALRLFNVQRSSKYGSGHFKVTGKSGEHRQQPDSIELSADRQTLSLRFPSVFAADIFDLQLILSSGSTTAPLHIFTNPSDLPEATKSDLKTLEQSSQKKETLRPGNVKHGAVHFKLFCAGCHSLTGDKLTGPDLSGIGTRATAPFLRESILNPTAQITEGFQPAMPSFAGVLDEQTLADLLTYLKSLKE